MSGHSKWAQIKRQKASVDARRSKLFSLLAKTITLEAKRAGGDRNLPGLRRAIAKAKEANLPNENIERAIKNALGGGNNFEEVIYEAYGPGGVALILEGITDNRNRTGQEIKHLLANHRASLATPGAAVWAFRKTAEQEWQATTRVKLEPNEREQLTALLAELEQNENLKNIYHNAEDFGD